MLPLAPDYYRRNFHFVVDFVLSHRAHLVDPGLRDFLETYLALGHDGQCLYVRLVTRKGTWFRDDKLRYEEFDVLEGVAALQQAGLISREAAIGAAELARLLTAAELAVLLGQRGSKQALVEALNGRHNQVQPLRNWWPEAPFSLLCQQGEEEVERLQLLFFANLRQDLSEFVVSSLAHVRYESVPLLTQDFPFQTPAQVRRYQYRARQGRAWQEGELDHRRLAECLQVADDHPRLERQRQRLALELARQWEREGETTAALALYRHCHRAPARERRLRLYFAAGDRSRALATALAMWSQAEGEEERAVARRFLARLAKKGPLSWRAEPPFRPPQRPLALCYQGDVEAAVVNHLQQQGKAAWHCENALVPTLAALLCWEVIFQPGAGAFVQPFQAGPLDLFAPRFRSRCRAALSACLTTWQSKSRAEFNRDLLARYRRHRGTACALAHWGRVSEPLLRQALEGARPEQWLELVRYLLTDLAALRRGLPDLLVVDESGLVFVEVKGPGDSLREHQRRWLHRLSQAGFRAEIWHIERLEVASVAGD